MESQEFDPKEILNNASMDVELQEKKVNMMVAQAIHCLSDADDFLVIAGQKSSLDKDRDILKYHSKASEVFLSYAVELLVEEIENRNMLIHIHKSVRERIRKLDASQQTG